MICCGQFTDDRLGKCFVCGKPNPIKSNKLWLISLLLLFFIGCSTQKEIITDKTIDIVTPIEPVKESLELQPVNLDTVDLLEVFTDSSFLQAEKITDNAIVKVKVRKNKENKLIADIDVKQADIKQTITYRDTTSIIKESKSFFDYVNYILIGACVLICIVLILKFWK